MHIKLCFHLHDAIKKVKSRTEVSIELLKKELIFLNEENKVLSKATIIKRN